MLSPLWLLKPTQTKKRIVGSIRAKLKEQTTALNHSKGTENTVEYKQCSYSLRKKIKQANVSTETKWSRNSTARTRDACGRDSRK